MTEWGFLTNHGRALLCIANDPGVRLRDIADLLSITERSAYAIVNDLSSAGYVLKEREGRRNRYIVQEHLPLPETTIRERTIGEVLDLLVGTNHSRRANNGTKTPTLVKPRTPGKKATRASRAKKPAK
jgi:predicted DNA-binding transcriptional regulator YafY